MLFGRDWNTGACRAWLNAFFFAANRTVAANAFLEQSPLGLLKIAHLYRLMWTVLSLHVYPSIADLCSVSKVTFSAVKPRNPVFARHSHEVPTSARLGSRRRSVLKAICPSIRAKGAPKQKCAAQPNARWRLSARLRSSRSGLANCCGSRFAAAMTAMTAVPFLIV